LVGVERASALPSSIKAQGPCDSLRVPWGETAAHQEEQQQAGARGAGAEAQQQDGARGADAVQQAQVWQDGGRAVVVQQEAADQQQPGCRGLSGCGRATARGLLLQGAAGKGRDGRDSSDAAGRSNAGGGIERRGLEVEHGRGD